MRRTLGTAVFSGMLGVTLFGIFLTPVFYYVIQWFSDLRAERLRRTSEVAEFPHLRAPHPQTSGNGHPIGEEEHVAFASNGKTRHAEDEDRDEDLLTTGVEPRD